MFPPESKKKVMITALYERLSRDDENQGESNSITNQKKYLEDYARANGFKNLRHFSDDGYSGTNFDRPAFNELLELVDAGMVETVIVKDLSRFGRNYLQVGIYTEMRFPEKGVRFIAVNNGVDSLQPETSDFTPFLNLMNEWYARDTSNKIRAIFKARMKNGKRCSGSIPYGYRRDSKDKNHLVVDPEPAAVVRLIFERAADGISSAGIAEELTQKQVLIPAAYAERYHQENMRCHAYHDPCLWTKAAVVTILDRMEYLGHTVLGKTICENFKTKKRRKAKPEELLIFEHTHEAIVDEETWHTAQRCRKRLPKRTRGGTESYMMSGMVFCADCGKRMYYRSKFAQHRQNGKVYDCDEHFRCSTYESRYAECTYHYVRVSVLEKLVLAAIRRAVSVVHIDEQEFIRQTKSQWAIQQEEALKADKRELEAAQKRIAELDVLIRKLYEGNATGKIPDRQFDRMLPMYDAEQMKLEADVERLERVITESSAEQDSTDKFIELCKKYREVSELTPRILNEFIEKIVVHESVKETGLPRRQKIEIHFNFIGLYIPPVSEEEIAAEREQAEREQREKEQERKQRLLENTRRCRERKRAELAELEKQAETDPAAAEKVRQIKAHQSECRRRASARRKERFENDPEFHAYEAERRRRNGQNSYQRSKEKRAAEKATVTSCDQSA